jgi:hypothetical protein
MGRPSVHADGPMTAAERMRRFAARYRRNLPAPQKINEAKSVRYWYYICVFYRFRLTNGKTKFLTANMAALA